VETEAVAAASATATPTPTPDPKAALFTSGPNTLQPAGALPLATATPEAPMATPVPWTPPNPGKTTTIIYPGYTVVYSPALGNPLAVQYAMVGGAKPKRYPPPITVKTPKATLIEAAGYQRGEIALQESISLYFGASSGKNTTLMTNLCAFNPACLAGPWAQFAAMEKRYAGDYGWIEVVAGPIFNTPPSRSANGLVVPDAFYRVYRRSYGDTMAFIIPQTATSTTLTGFLTSIATVEAATGVAIFTNTVTPEERANVATAVW
jgi:DNA/RNA endonuclease G (NUC1)